MEAAIASVRDQIYPGWELCICNDASTAAHVREVLDAAAAADPRVRVMHRETNGHIAQATNDAIGMARGSGSGFSITTTFCEHMPCCTWRRRWPKRPWLVSSIQTRTNWMPRAFDSIRISSLTSILA